MNKQKLYVIKSVIEEDDYRECTLGPFKKRPTKKQAEDVCLAYTHVPHDGTRPAYFEIENVGSNIYEDVNDFMTKEDLYKELEDTKKFLELD